MAIIFKNLKIKIVRTGPLLLLYYLSISEIDTNFSNMFEILSFNLQIIIIYYWTIKDETILGNGNIFLVGIINDVITGLPLGLSAVTYLTVSFVASYIKNITVNFSLFTDWFTFIIAIFFSNLLNIILINKFTILSLTYVDVFYNSFFTFLFFPVLWLFFNIYRSLILKPEHD